MKSRCTNQEIGNLCHSYELGLLTEEETDRFLTHLLTCDHCFTELQRFETQAQLLRSHESISREVSDVATEPIDESFVARLKQWLWPKTPLIFRPAVAMLVIVLLAYPAWMGIVQRPNDYDITPLSEISLLPMRSAAVQTYTVPTGLGVVVEFVCYGCQADGSYQVEIADADGMVLQRIDGFNTFDEYETGRVLMNAESAQPGVYSLTVKDVSTDPPEMKQKYAYRIAR